MALVSVTFCEAGCVDSWTESNQSGYSGRPVINNIFWFLMLTKCKLNLLVFWQHCAVA